MDWLFGSNGPPEAELALHLAEAHHRIEQLQRASEVQQQSRLQELEAIRHSRAEIEARVTERERELERVNHELLAEKAANEAARTEIARLTRVAADARTTSVREAELRRKLNARCSTLELELEKSRALAETQTKWATDLDHALQEQRRACDEAQAVIATQRAELLRHEGLVRSLEQAGVRARAEFVDLQALGRAQLKAQQGELEQRHKDLAVARTDVKRLRQEVERQKASLDQAVSQQHVVLEAERRAWAEWLGQVWGALIYTLGPAAPLALETSLGKLEPMARAATPEAAEARLREFLSARSLCRNVTIHDQQQELRLELEPGPAIEGTAAGWLGILATRYLGAMLERPLRTRQIEQAGTHLAVHATWRIAANDATRLAEPA
jgi:DNA repair exonuclease SbcCD ATPase subunit